MSKRVKEMLIAEVEGRIKDSTEMLVVNSSRLDAITDNRFRLALREKDINILTVKNSLARKALNNAGVSSLDPVLDGPSSLVWGCEDIVALSKEIARWAKELDGLEIKGGTVEGETLDANDVDALSKSPSREELISKIVMLALSPGARIAGALLGPGGTIAAQLKTIADKVDKADEEGKEDD